MVKWKTSICKYSTIDEYISFFGPLAFNQLTIGKLIKRNPEKFLIIAFSILTMTIEEYYWFLASSTALKPASINTSEIVGCACTVFATSKIVASTCINAVASEIISVALAAII